MKATYHGGVAPPEGPFYSCNYEHRYDVCAEYSSHRPSELRFVKPGSGIVGQWLCAKHIGHVKDEFRAFKGMVDVYESMEHYMSGHQVPDGASLPGSAETFYACASDMCEAVYSADMLFYRACLCRPAGWFCMEGLCLEHEEEDCECNRTSLEDWQESQRMGC